MKRRMQLFIFACMYLTVLPLGAPAAKAIAWNVYNPSGALASPHTYRDITDTFEITASGFTTADGPHGRGAYVYGAAFWLAGMETASLFGKVTPGDPGETGLGLAEFPNNGIQPRTWIQLDLADLNFSELNISISGVQPGEGFVVFGGDTAAAEGSMGTLLHSAQGYGVFPGPPGVQTFTLVRTFPYEWITATAGDVLIREVTISTPEPACLPLLGSGIILLIVMRKRFAKTPGE